MGVSAPSSAAKDGVAVSPSSPPKLSGVLSLVFLLLDDDAFYLFLQKQKRAYGHIPISSEPQAQTEARAWVKTHKYVVLAETKNRSQAPYIPLGRYVP